MSAISSGPRWRVVLQPRWLCWHAVAVVAFFGMMWLGDWQLHRALAGNELSWAYTFEWPLFAIFGVYFWVRTIRDEIKIAAADADGANTTTATAGTALTETAAIETAENPEQYVARLLSEVRGHGRWHGFR